MDEASKAEANNRIRIQNFKPDEKVLAILRTETGVEWKYNKNATSHYDNPVYTPLEQPAFIAEVVVDLYVHHDWPGEDIVDVLHVWRADVKSTESYFELSVGSNSLTKTLFMLRRMVDASEHIWGRCV